MAQSSRVARGAYVSLFTREWIEIVNLSIVQIMRDTSPSLRGSGLKFYSLIKANLEIKRLPLYEGVD